MAEAKAKADDIEAKLHSGGRLQPVGAHISDGTTAAEGGDLGTYKRGQLGRCLKKRHFRSRPESDRARFAPSRDTSS